MSADNNIVERLSDELVAANKFGDTDLANVLREAAAEIVRLRGEVEHWKTRARVNLSELDDLRARAEAKGDAPERCGECRHTTFERRYDGSHICVHCKTIHNTPQPAGGEAAAPAVDFERFRKAVGCMRFTAQALRGMAKAAMDQEANALDALIDRLVTTPPAAQVQSEASIRAEEYTRGRNDGWEAAKAAQVQQTEGAMRASESRRTATPEVNDAADQLIAQVQQEAVDVFSDLADWVRWNRVQDPMPIKPGFESVEMDRFRAWWHKNMPNLVSGDERSDRALALEAWRASLHTRPAAGDKVRVTEEMFDNGLAALLAFRKSGDDWTGKPAHAVRAVLEAALQHRGDSRGGEG